MAPPASSCAIWHNTPPQDIDRDDEITVDDDLALLEEQHEQLMFAQCFPATSSTSSAAVVTNSFRSPAAAPKAKSPGLLRQGPPVKENRNGPSSLQHSPSRFVVIGGMILFVIVGVSLTTGAIFIFRSQASNATVPLCQLNSSSCYNGNVRMMASLPLCALTEYERLKTELEPRDQVYDGSIESCQPANLALWQVAVDLQQQEMTYPSIPMLTAAATSAASSAPPFDDINNEDINQGARPSMIALMNRFVLYTVYFSTNTKLPLTSPSKTNLDDSCLWDGVICNVHNRIMVLDFSNFTLGPGPIPTELGLLSSSLRVLDLGYNAFTGTLVSELGHLTLLRSLSLVHNAFTGTLPDALSSMKQLRTLQLDHNAFTGTVSTAAMHLEDLKALSLASNLFQGRLPNSLTRSYFLQYVDVSDNQLSGTVDLYALFNSESLTFLDLSSNSNLDIASSMMSLDLGYVSSLRYLDLSGIPVHEGSGSIDRLIVSRLYLLPYLTDLRLSDMGWTGNLPESLFTMFDSNLVLIDLAENSFAGTIFSSLSLALYDKTLNISPVIISPSLESIRLSSNMLSGPIPSSFATLDELWLQNNYFTGRIPNAICEKVSALEADFCSPTTCGAYYDTDCPCVDSCPESSS